MRAKQSQLIMIDYRGESKSLRQWATEVNIPFLVLYKRIFLRSWSIEKAFTSLPKKMRTHGQCETKLYKVWSSMKHRCSNPNDQSYKNYGGRGIGFYDEWKNFEPFHVWAMYSGYRTGLTIERHNNEGNYEPSNCVWIPKGKQSMNTRRCKIIVYKGEEHNIKEWALKFRIPYHRLQSRLKHGWDIAMALTVPVIPHSLRHSNSDEKRMIKTVQQATGIPTYSCA